MNRTPQMHMANIYMHAEDAESVETVWKTGLSLLGRHRMKWRSGQYPFDPADGWAVASFLFYASPEAALEFFSEWVRLAESQLGVTVTGKTLGISGVGAVVFDASEEDAQRFGKFLAQAADEPESGGGA